MRKGEVRGCAGWCGACRVGLHQWRRVVGSRFGFDCRAVAGIRVLGEQPNVGFAKDPVVRAYLAYEQANDAAYRRLNNRYPPLLKLSTTNRQDHDRYIVGLMKKNGWVHRGGSIPAAWR